MLLLLQKSCDQLLQESLALSDNQRLLEEFMIVLLVVFAISFTAFGWSWRAKYRECPFCDATISTRATVCKKCRREMPAVSAKS